LFALRPSSHDGVSRDFTLSYCSCSETRSAIRQWRSAAVAVGVGFAYGAASTALYASKCNNHNPDSQWRSLRAGRKDTRGDVDRIRRSTVHRRDPPAPNGVGNQTNGRRHRNCGREARLWFAKIKSASIFGCRSLGMRESAPLIRVWEESRGHWQRFGGPQSDWRRAFPRTRAMSDRESDSWQFDSGG
jgi:hypothetical protein